MESYKQLEKEFAQFVGTKYAVAVNTGTAALHLSMVALGIGMGDEVIVPDFTMAACAFAVSYTGATPVFVDCGLDLNIDVTKIEEKITPRTRAIMPVHIYGRVCDMDEIMRLADKYNLHVIEDCSEAHGAKVGMWGDVGCFSLYKNKIIHAEEGGIITTNSKELYDKMQDLKSMAFGKEHNFYHEEIGFNYRMTESQARLALQSLHMFPENMKRRREIEEIYRSRLNGHDRLRDAVWVFDFLVDQRDEKVRALFDKGARHFFKPMTTLPMYREDREDSYARLISEKGMYLPVREDMTDEQVHFLIDVLLKL